MPTQYIVDAAGNVRAVESPEAAQRASDEGKTFLSPDYARQAAGADAAQQEMEGRWGSLAQGAMGFGSGLTLGLGPAASTEILSLIDPATGKLAKRDLGAMQSSSPFFAGEVAGMLAPVVFSGGEALGARAGIEAGASGGLASRVFGATPAGLLSAAGGASERLALRALPEASSALGSFGRSAVSMAARGMTEGALVNLTNTISQSIIKDQPLTAQTLAASGADGALFGGLVGGGLGLTGAAIGGLADLGLNAAAKASPKAALRRLGATAKDVAEMESEGSVREALKGYHDSVMQPGGVNFRNTPAEINRVAKESKASFQKVLVDGIETLQKEAPQFVPDPGRVFQRLQDEILTPAVGNPAYQQVAKAVGRVEKAIQNVGEAGGTKGYGTWGMWLETRNQLNNIGKLVTDPQLNSVVKSRLMGIVDSELNEAMDAAGKSIGNTDLAKQFAAASAGERMATRLEEMTARRVAQDASGKAFGMGGGELGQAAWMTAMGHPVAAAGMMGMKAAGGRIAEALEPAIAQRAYELAVGAKAAAGVVNTKSSIRSAVDTFLKGRTRAGQSVGGIKSRADYEKRLERTSELVSPNHQSRVAEYADSVAAFHQEKLAQEIMATYGRAADYLRYNMPPSTAANKSTSLMRQPENMSLSADEWKFLRIDQIIKHPMGLLDNLEDGTVTPEEVKAVKYVYPELYHEVVSGVTQGIFELKQAGEFVSLEKVTQLGIVLDAPIDPVLEPSFIADVQASLDIPQEPGPEPQAQPNAIDPTQLMTPMQQSSYGAT